MAKTKAKKAKMSRKPSKKPSKTPLRRTICGIRHGASKSTQWRDATRKPTKNEVLVAKAIEELRKLDPHKKHFGRSKVHTQLKGKLSMDVVRRLLSKKRGRVFPGRDKVFPDAIKSHWKEAAKMRENGEFIELSQNTCCRVSRKANWC